MQPKFICFALILFVLPCLLFGQTTDTTFKNRKGSKKPILFKKITPPLGYKTNDEPGLVDLIVDEDSGPQYSCITANAGNNVTICPGSSTTIGANTYNSNYDYSWSPSTGLSSSSIPNPIASPGQTTTYTLTMTPKPNLLINGSFEQGNYGFTSDYTENAGSYNYQAFAITNSPSNVYPWFCQKSPPNGSNMFVGDGAITSNQKVWSQSLIVNPNQQYTFSGQFSSVFNANNGNDTHIIIDINGTRAYSVLSNNNCQDWTTLTLAWYAGPYDNFVTITIYADPGVSGTGFGNDFAMDNLVFTPGSCNITTSSVTVDLAEKPVINQTTPIEWCFIYDAIQPLTLSTSATGTLQWYKDGIAISGANQQTITQEYSTWGIPPINPRTFVYTVNNGCQTSDPVTVIAKATSGNGPNISYDPTNYLLFTTPVSANSFFDPSFTIAYNPQSPGSVDYINRTTNYETARIGIPNVTTFPASFDLGITTQEFGCYLTRSYSITFDGIPNHYPTITINSKDKGKTVLSKKITSESSNPSISEFDFSISPNPATNVLRITSKTPYERVEIFTEIGQLTKSVKNIMQKTTLIINVSDLKPSVYFVKLIHNGKFSFKKIIVVK